jgi:hypothetical protein
MFAPLFFLPKKIIRGEIFGIFGIFGIFSINSTKFANFLGGEKKHYTNNKPKLGYRTKKL